MAQTADPDFIPKNVNVKDLVNRLSRDMSKNQFSFQAHSEKKQQPQLLVGLFPYTGQQEDELTFSVGDVIEFLEDVEDGWNRGRLKSTGVVGMFPTNFVGPKTINSITSTRPKAATTTTNEVNMRSEPKAIERTPSTVLSELNTILKTDPKTTIFPIHAATSTATTAHEVPEVQKMKEMARVKFVYNPQHPDELALHELDLLIHVISKDCGDAGWFEGELNGKKGVFPDNFVELVQVPSNTESGQKYANLSPNRLGDRILNKPPPVNPPQPAVPPKPVKMKVEPTVSTSGTGMTATSSTASPAPVKNSFAALRDKITTNLKVVAPEQVASMQQKSVEFKERSSSVDGPDLLGGLEVENGSGGAGGDQVSELQHITKNRARPPKSRPMSMVMNRNRSSDESPTGRISSPTSTSNVNIPNAMSASMFMPTTNVKEPSISPTITPFKPSTTPAIVPPSSATKPALRPVISNNFGDSSVETPKKPEPSTASAPVQPSEFVSRAEYDALLDRVRMLEARLIAVEKFRL